MKKPRFSRIVVKIGSNVLARPDGTLDLTRMSALVDQVADLRRAGLEVVLVSSGAVASGRSELRLPKARLENLDDVERRQLFSAVGQAKLINRYYELFREHRIPVGQVLTMKENFSTRHHYLNQRACMEVMLRNGVLPIVNENDTVSVTELMFTDNDELSGLVATMMDAQALVILSNVDGLFDGSPTDPAARLIPEVKAGADLERYVQSTASGFGRGGMKTKYGIARQVAAEGLHVYIANGKRDGILPALLLGCGEARATHFQPGAGELSSVKRWIAHSGPFAKGALYLNAQAVEAISGDKAVSILPVGLVRVTGEFEKDDLVRICTEDGTVLGFGRSAYDAAEAADAVGQHKRRPIVHYDYLYLS